MRIKKSILNLAYSVLVISGTLLSPPSLAADNPPPAVLSAASTQTNTAVKPPELVIAPVANKPVSTKAPVTTMTNGKTSAASLLPLTTANKTPALTTVSLVTSTPSPAPVVASTPEKPKVDSHIWNLQNADILSVINEVSKETGKNFLVDSRVTGRVNLVANKILPPDELYSVFLSVLQVYGFAAIPDGKVVKIVPNLNASELAPALSLPHTPVQGDEIVSGVISVKFISAAQLVSILRPLLPQWASIAAYSPTNSLIITGPALNINNIRAIVKEIDSESNSGTDIVMLKNANAKQIVTILQNLQTSMQAGGGNTQQPAISEDARTNSIILSGSQEERLRLRVIISELDSPIENGVGGGTQVVFLRYLSAKKIAPILDKIATGQSNLSSQPKTAEPAAAPSSDSGSTGNSSSGSSEGEDNADNLTAVLPELDNNALVITASSSIMQNLKNIIQQLDIRPAEVFVQAIIVELDASNTEQLGIQWGSFDNNPGNSSSGSQSGQAGATTGFQDGPGMAIIQNGRFQELISALRGMSGANILSEPTVMILDNKKASLSVGQQISYQTQALASGGAVSPGGDPIITSNFQQENVGLSLDVTPQVDQDQAIQLLIDQKNGSLQNPDNPGNTPIINQSEIKTTVMINSGDILVVGGLMSNSMTVSTYDTPILSDIPLIGRLFSYKSHDLEKKDLLVFIRPVIVSSPLVGTQITNKKYKYIRSLQQRWNSKTMAEDNPNDRLLPPYDEDLKLPVPFSDDE